MEQRFDGCAALCNGVTEFANVSFSLTFQQLVRSDGDKAELIVGVPHLTAQELEGALLPQLLLQGLPLVASRLFTIKFMDTRRKRS